MVQPRLSTEEHGHQLQDQLTSQSQDELILDQVFQRLSVSSEDIARFCQAGQIVYLACFGSILRLDFRESGDRPSDIDFLFEWAGGVNQSLLRRVAMQ